MKVSIVVGRFQVHELHPGHTTLIDTANYNSDRTIILLGCTKDGAKDDRNPYSISERAATIRERYPINRNSHFIGVIFDRDTDEEWSSDLDDIISSMTEPHDEVMLYHSRDSFKDHYKGKYATHEIAEIPGYSGTKVREQLKQQIKENN